MPSPTAGGPPLTELKNSPHLVPQIFSKNKNGEKEVYMLSTIALLYLIFIIGCPVWIKALVITELAWKAYEILCWIYNAGKESKR